MSRVFFFEKVKHDISACEKYGQPVFLMANGETRASLFDQNLIKDIARKLEDYRFSPQDFIAITGQLNPVVLLVAAVAENFDNVDLLLFDARDNDYHRVTLNTYGSESIK